MREFLIDHLMPANEVSLFYGPPGVGKTNLICQWVTLMLDNKSLLDAYQAKPNLSIAYVAYDRSESSVCEMLTKHNLVDRIAWKSFRDVSKPYSEFEERPINHLKPLFPTADLIIIDGLGFTIPKGKNNDYQAVGNYIRYCGTLAQQGQFTMLGILHSPKERAKDRILNPRQQSHGSTAWAGTTECQIYMSFIDPTDPANPTRMLWVMPHTSNALQVPLQFNKQGFLIPWETLKEDDIRDIWFKQLPKEFKRSEAVDIAEKLNQSPSVIDRWLKYCLNIGYLRQPKYGIYQKVLPS